MSKVENGITSCPKCDNAFSVKIRACPKCGHELTEEERLAGIKKNNKNMLGCLGILVIAAVAYFAWPQTEIPPPSYTLLPYSHAQTKDTSARADRKRARVGLVLDAAASPVTAENLAATCMSAAKYYAGETSAKALQILIHDQQGTDWGHTLLATCSYSPDNGGWSGDQGWTWDDVKAAKRTTTPQEKEIATLWNAMRADFQKGGSTNEKALSEAIGKKLGISPEDVHLSPVLTEKIAFTPFTGVKEKGPAADPAPAPVAQPEPAPAPLPALTKQQARDEVQALLNDLDRFRTTSMFKQCIYGCGDKNPATAWNAKRDALQGQLGQQRDLPVMLKAAPGYLWSLGMAYGKNNAKDIKDYRGMVEEGLTD